MANVNLRKVLSYRPGRWNQDERISLRRAIYVKRLVSFIKGKRFTEEDLFYAWNVMLKIKSSGAKVYPNNRVSLPEALAAFFEGLSLEITKKHYAAFIEAAYN